MDLDEDEDEDVIRVYYTPCPHYPDNAMRLGILPRKFCWDSSAESDDEEYLKALSQLSVSTSSDKWQKRFRTNQKRRSAKKEENPEEQHSSDSEDYSNNPFWRSRNEMYDALSADLDEDIDESRRRVVPWVPSAESLALIDWNKQTTEPDTLDPNFTHVGIENSIQFLLAEAQDFADHRERLERLRKPYSPPIYTPSDFFDLYKIA